MCMEKQSSIVLTILIDLQAGMDALSQSWEAFRTFHNSFAKAPQTGRTKSSVPAELQWLHWLHRWGRKMHTHRRSKMLVKPKFLLRFSSIPHNSLRFSRIFWNFVGFCGIFWDFSGVHRDYSRIFRDFLGFPENLQNFLCFSATFESFPRFYVVFEFFWYFPAFLRMFRDFSQDFPRFSGSS